MKETKLHGMERFVSAVMEEAHPIAVRMVKNKKAHEVLKNILFDEPGDRYMGIVLSPQEKTLKNIVFGISEIEESFQVLSDIPFYLKRFPPKNSNISKTRFLNYHVGNYLNENYILRERLVAYQKVVTRMYRHDGRLIELGRQVKKIEMVVSGFDGIVATRGKHVHQKRYDDEDFERLHFFERMAKDDDPLASLLGELYPLALKEYRIKWIKTVSENNDNIKRILDMYFEILYGVVFGENGKFVYPKSA
jgi:hypothetical protein